MCANTVEWLHPGRCNEKCGRAKHIGAATSLIDQHCILVPRARYPRNSVTWRCSSLQRRFAAVCASNVRVDGTLRADEWRRQDLVYRKMVSIVVVLWANLKKGANPSYVFQARKFSFE